MVIERNILSDVSFKNLGKLSGPLYLDTFNCLSREFSLFSVTIMSLIELSDLLEKSGK